MGPIIISEQSKLNNPTHVHISSQGPPGTGKSRALAGMVKALCRVFLDAGKDDLAEQFGFRPPSTIPLVSWSPDNVAAWLQSLVPIEAAATREGGRKCAEGVTEEIKRCLCEGLKVKGAIIAVKGFHLAFCIFYISALCIY